MALLYIVQPQVGHYYCTIINTNGMNVDDKAKVDHILVPADIFVPDSSPELLEAVRVGLSQFTLYVQMESMPP